MLPKFPNSFRIVRSARRRKHPAWAYSRPIEYSLGQQRFPPRLEQTELDLLESGIIKRGFSC